MTEKIIYYPQFNHHLQGVIHLPASKSICNRVLLIQALCGDFTNISNVSESSYTQILLKSLWLIDDHANLQTIDVEDAGSAFRFLTAFLACQESGQYLLKGTERMHQRPISGLVEALRTIGADIQYTEREHYPPLLIKGRTLKGGTINIEGHISSQFISALCLIAPMLTKGLVINITHDIVSAPYIHMTLRLMEMFGVHATFERKQIIIPIQTYFPITFFVENDWSSLGFFYAMAMLSNTVAFVVTGLQEDSVQGDAYIKTWAVDLGIESYFEYSQLHIKKKEDAVIKPAQTYDFSAYPDLAIPLIVACAIKYPDVRFTGLQHLQYKESDRIASLSSELKKVDIDLHFDKGLLSIDNSAYKASGDTIYFNTFHDHRIAMALSMFALEGFKVVFDDASCVKKSFPNYFEQLQALGFQCNGSNEAIKDKQ